MRNAELHKDHRKRMREKFAKNGLSVFKDHEILEMLLFYTVPRRDTNETGHNLLKKFGSLGGVFSASKQELCTVEGIGDASADYIVFLGEIYREMTSEMFAVIPLSEKDAAGSYAFLMMMQAPAESALAVFLGDDGIRIREEWLNLGKGKMTDDLCAEIISVAKECGAVDIIVTHNHKGEPLEPSPDDIVITETLKRKAESVGIRSLRHVIVSENGYIFI